MTKETKEIYGKIQDITVNASVPCSWQIPPILEQMTRKIAELEKRLEAAEGYSQHANNIASCLANGIIPD